MTMFAWYWGEISRVEQIHGLCVTSSESAYEGQGQSFPLLHHTHLPKTLSGFLNGYGGHGSFVDDKRDDFNMVIVLNLLEGSPNNETKHTFHYIPIFPLDFPPSRFFKYNITSTNRMGFDGFIAVA